MAQRTLSPKELIAAKNATKAQPKSESAPSSPSPPIESKTKEMSIAPQTPQKTQNEPLNENSPMKDSPLPSNSLTLECVRQGKDGWLYRENECFRSDDEEYQQKIWGIVMEGRFCYYHQRPTNQSMMLESLLGYLELNFHSDCRIADRKIDKGVGKYCFRLKEQSTVIFLFANTEQERSEWIETLLDATRGIHHLNPFATSVSSTPILNHSSPQSPQLLSPLKRQVKRSSSAVQMGYHTVEYPKLAGYLKKKSIEGRTLGFKNTKLRWFRLECGEIRYYKSDHISSETLKGTFQLRGCLMPNGDVNEGDRISITRSDGFLLMMTASTIESAREWRAAIKATLEILNEIYGDSRGTSGKIRRSNLSTIYDDESLKHVTIEKSAQTIEVLTSALRSHFLLRDLQDYGPLLDCLEQHVFLSADVILWQDTVTSHLHLIESGQVEVIKDNKIITKLGSGKIINELALVNDLTCSSTIRAHTTVIIWTLHRKFLRNFLQKIENNFKCSQIEFLKTVTMFEKLNDLTLRQIADVLKIAKYECGERIIKQGEVGEKFYLLVQGQVSVTQSGHTSAASAFLSGGATSTPRELVQLGIGKYFGELALISNEPRKANVVALTSPVICYTLDKQSFTSILGTLHEAETESTGITILRKVKLLSGLSEKQLLIIAKCLETVRYVAGEEIIRQGEEGERFFMIVSGEVLVTVNHVEVARLKSGSYFGEMALMNNERRNATITAVISESENITSEGGEEGRGDVVCLTLNRTEFVRFLGPLDQILKEEAQRREEEASNRGLLGTAKRLTKSFAQSFLSPRSSVKKVTGIGVASSVEYDLDEFQHIRTLGYGRFGSVKLVKREGFNGVYALKILFKQPLLDLNLQQSPYQERDLLQLFDHPFIPAIYATFQDQHCFYLLLEAIPGGDFWTILYDRQSWTKIDTRSNLGGLYLEIAKFYFANVLCAVEYLHHHEVVYRDLKPENLVMDRTGYLKLVDFGSAKKLPVPCLTNTICGTPEYLAPEMITAQGHNRAVDYWAMGVFLHELMMGRTPFDHNDMGTIYHSILSSGNSLASQLRSLSIDPHARDLILSLLEPMPGLRLGMLRNGIADIWNHSFLADLTPSLFLNKSISPPLRPDIEHLLDPTPLDDMDIAMDSTFSGKYNFPDF